MKTLRVTERTGADGVLHVRIPLGTPEADFDVVLVVQPRASSSSPTSEEGDWPVGFFDATFGSIADASFQRPPQGELPKAVELD